jgi:hypothetical protein
LATFDELSESILDMQDCVDEAIKANINILYTFYNDGRCLGFTAEACPDGLSESNPAFESAVIQYVNPTAPCLSLSPCDDIDPDDYFKKITAKASHGKAGILRGKRVRYTLTLVPRKEQPSPPLQPSLDLRIDLSPFLEVTKTHMKRPAGSSAITAAIDRAADTVTWANIGDALLGVGRKKAVPQKLTFTIVATLAADTPKGADIEIEAYLVDDEGNVCEVLVAETEVLVRDPSRLENVK